MTREQFERETKYQTAMSVARSMLRDGLISKEEYHTIDTIIIEKYLPLIGGL